MLYGLESMVFWVNRDQAIGRFDVDLCQLSSSAQFHHNVCYVIHCCVGEGSAYDKILSLLSDHAKFELTFTKVGTICDSCIDSTRTVITNGRDNSSELLMPRQFVSSNVN